MAAEPSSSVQSGFASFLRLPLDKPLENSWRELMRIWPKAMNTSEFTSWPTNPYPTRLDSLDSRFPRLWPCLLLFLPFPLRLLLQVPHPSLVIFLTHLAPSSPQGLCAHCSIRNSAPRELWGLLSDFLLVRLINVHLWREVFPQLPVNKTAYRQSKLPFSDLSCITFSIHLFGSFLLLHRIHPQRW